jgi:hypothetical protein
LSHKIALSGIERSKVAHPFSIHKSAARGLSVLPLEGYWAHTAPEFEKTGQAEFEAGGVG